MDDKYIEMGERDINEKSRERDGKIERESE
jgi:hypothetical protein